MFKRLSNAAVAFILVWTVMATPAFAQQGKAPALPQRPSVVDRFLQQYAQEHPLVPGLVAQPTPQSAFFNRFLRRPRILNQPGREAVCSIPLLQQKIDRTKSYSIQEIHPPPVDTAMTMKPTAPTCVDSAVNQK